MKKVRQVSKTNGTMSIICSKCGGTRVTCEALIDPNTKKFDRYTDESFLYGWCDDCKTGTVLTDVDGVKNEIKEKHQVFYEKNRMEPQYANCRVAWKDNRDCCDVKIMLSSDTGLNEEDIFFYCDSLDGLQSLAGYGKADFIVTECYGFKMLTEAEVMQRHTFEYEVEGKTISVTGKEALDFYGEHYGIKRDTLEVHAAHYACHIKYYREYCTRTLDQSLVKRLLDEEVLMKKGETDCFKLQLAFAWYVEIRKEDDVLYKPFRYTLNARCLDNAQNFDRRYVTLEAALLHCLNHFNENAQISDHYKSVNEYLSKDGTY